MLAMRMLCTPGPRGRARGGAAQACTAAHFEARAVGLASSRVDTHSVGLDAGPTGRAYKRITVLSPHVSTRLVEPVCPTALMVRGLTVTVQAPQSERDIKAAGCERCQAMLRQTAYQAAAGVFKSAAGLGLGAIVSDNKCFGMHAGLAIQARVLAAAKKHVTCGRAHINKGRDTWHVLADTVQLESEA